MRRVSPKISPVAPTLIIAAVMGLTSWLVPAFAYGLPASRVVAVGLAVLGVCTGVSAVVSFRQAATTVNPLRPETASSLVVTGVYRFTRNPMYLGLLVVLFGWAVFLECCRLRVATPVRAPSEPFSNRPGGIGARLLVRT